MRLMMLETYRSSSAAEGRKGILDKENSIVRVRRLRVQKLRGQVLEPTVLPLNCHVMVGSLPPPTRSQFRPLYNEQINGAGLLLYTASFWRLVRRHLVQVKAPSAPHLPTVFSATFTPWKTLSYLSKPQLSPPGSLLWHTPTTPHPPYTSL